LWGSARDGVVQHEHIYPALRRSTKSGRRNVRLHADQPTCRRAVSSTDGEERFVAAAAEGDLLDPLVRLPLERLQDVGTVRPALGVLFREYNRKASVLAASIVI